MVKLFNEIHLAWRDSDHIVRLKFNTKFYSVSSLV